MAVGGCRTAKTVDESVKAEYASADSVRVECRRESVSVDAEEYVEADAGADSMVVVWRGDSSREVVLTVYGWHRREDGRVRTAVHGSITDSSGVRVAEERSAVCAEKIEDKRVAGSGARGGWLVFGVAALIVLWSVWRNRRLS